MGELLKIINKPLSEQDQIPLFYPFDIPDGAAVLRLDKDPAWSNILYCGEVFMVQNRFLVAWV